MLPLEHGGLDAPAGAVGQDAQQPEALVLPGDFPGAFENCGYVHESFLY